MAMVGVSLVLLFLALASIARATAQENPSIVVDDAWRFTAVTDRLIRIEYDVAGRFVDEPTIAFVRAQPRGLWRGRATEAGWVVLNTTAVSVHYRPGSPPKTGSVAVASRTGRPYRWTWGDDPAEGNLRGTARTLDNSARTLDLDCRHKVSPTMDNSEMHCTWGLVSRAGWAVVNDTGAPVLRDSWFAPSRGTVDISVFLHGLDYAGAIKDFFHAAGPPGLPPRYALGTMFTRWFNFDSDSVMALVDEFESRSIPLDAWIFDMNWHIFGPWGSFTWNENSYPELQDLLAWFQGRQLPIAANMHEHNGITQKERTYEQVCKALGRAPGQDIPFDLYNKSYAMAQEAIAIGALDTKGGKQGIDFSWIDYQQGESDRFQQTRIPGINPTIVLNMLRSGGPARRGDNARPLILSRWGGLGNHRYPLGFSGDQLHDWQGLAFLPYFTSTAANVAFNYWSHDTVGGDSSDYELSTRWVQVSAWSPVLRFHDKGAGTGPGCAKAGACARILPWDLPTAYSAAVRSAVQARDELLPYIYTAAWSSAETGLALCRPMYYENPADDALYGLDLQYLFGPDMVISPITQPSGPTAKGFEEALGAIQWSVYAPAGGGGWVDRLDGNFVAGGHVRSTYGIRDVPGLVRQGAVIPMRPPRARGESSLARARRPLDALEFRVAPAEAFYTGGALSGQGRVTDDDGLTLDYHAGKLAVTVCSYDFKGRMFNVRLMQTGDFKGRPSLVDVHISFPQLPPLTVAAHTGAAGVSATHDWRRGLLGSVVTLHGVNLTAGASLEVAIDAAYAAETLPNFVGALGRLRRARYIKDALDVANIPYGEDRANLTSYVLAATRMSPDFAASMPKLWDGAVAQVTRVLETNGDLQGDLRRAQFIRAMLAPDGVTSAVPAPGEVLIM